MKKFFVSMGLAAVGTAGLHAAYAPDLGPLSSTKIWNISATLRGFYDDNYDTANDGLNPRGSYGFEVSPQLMLAVPLQQTELGLRNTYAMTYYQEREELGQSAVDQSDQLDLWVDHAFTERWQGKVMDTFILAQQPELLNPNGIITQPYRVNGDNFVNTATFTLNTDWTRLFSTSLNYQNAFYNYQNSGATALDVLPTSGGFLVPPGTFEDGTGKGASLAGLLNRIDQTVSLDFQWHVTPETVAFVGGSFEWVGYNGNEPIAYSLPLAIQTGNSIYYSQSRNSRSYTGYVGVQHSLLPNLNISAKAGATYSDYYNDPLSSPSVTPYAVLSLIYTYSPGSYAEIGFNQVQNSTDVATTDATSGKLTLNQETSDLYCSLNQQITQKLLGSIIGSWQYSVYNEGQYNGQPDNYYTLGLNLSYTFTPHFSAEFGYNLNDLQSNIYQRGYTQNIVYIGVTAAY